MTGLLLLAAATALLVVGAELFVDNAAAAAGRLGTSLLVVGLLLAGAEPEELLTGLIASGAGHGGLAAGDAIGANVTMLTLAIGLAALIRPVPVSGRVRLYAVLSAVAGALAVLTLLDGHVGRVEGLLLLLAYVALVAVIWRRERRPPVIGELAEIEAEGPGSGPAGRALLLTLAGLVVMTLGGRLAVAGADHVVRSLHQSDSSIGLTLLALATTAELFALVFAAVRRDVPELAVAGIVGSAAYNATATLGAAALLRPVDASAVLLPAVGAAALPLVMLALARSGAVRRLGGLVLLAAYAGFVGSVVLR